MRLIATGLAVLAAASFALPANAAEGNAAFFSGANQSGTKSPVDLANGACVNTVPVRSGANISSADIDVFYGANCSGSSYYVLGSLHQGTFPFPALSYRVR